MSKNILSFGSYDPDHVTWLLKDLSDVELEAPLEEREEAVQKGKAHYAESLPIEYQPGESYLNLFKSALYGTEGYLMAKAVGALVNQLVDNKKEPGRIVLVSLARAGTPVGILMKMFAKRVYGLHWEHYSVSIVRGKGIDYNALDYIATQHRSEDIVFVDGWTGKGAISRELSLALSRYNLSRQKNFSDKLAVLADPADCATFYGTTEDFLIPSACLNSTVSGLISRTVLNDNYIGEKDFHGAKFYKELLDQDYSNILLDVVSSHFPRVVDEIKYSEKVTPNFTPSWSGWELVVKLAEEFEIDNVNLIKPGVGETTRVLLRRIPWKILYRPDKKDMLGHIFELAKSRGVEMVPRNDIPYSCVGIIRPQDSMTG